MFEQGGRPKEDGKRRALIVLGSIAITAALLAATLALGAWAYEIRRWTLHAGRLERLNAQHPKIETVTEALVAETGRRPLPTPGTEAELRQLVSKWAPESSEEILAKRRKSADLRIFLVADMVYFIFFDEQGVMRDFACIST